MPTPKSRPGPGKLRGRPAPAASPPRSGSPEVGKKVPAGRPAKRDSIDFADPRSSALQLAYEILEHPEEWLRTVNPQFGDRRPIDLLGTDEEFKVSRLLLAVDAGFFA